MKQGHFKFINKTIKIPSFIIPELFKSYNHWFGLSINRPENLFVAKKYTRLIITPKTDTERRINQIIKCSRPGITFNFNNVDINKNEFLNIDFYITKNDKFNPNDIKIITPFGIVENRRLKGLRGIIRQEDKKYSIIIIPCIIEKVNVNIITDNSAKIYKIYPKK